MSKLWSNVRPAPLAQACAFCFPHAGGAASVFRGWPQYTGGELEIYAAQLPGRATRQSEPPITDFDALTDAAVRDILPLLGRPFVLFGHSMGALVAFEAAHRLRELNLEPPVHLFVSGEPAPTCPEHPVASP